MILVYVIVKTLKWKCHVINVFLALCKKTKCIVTVTVALVTRVLIEDKSRPGYRSQWVTVYTQTVVVDDDDVHHRMMSGQKRWLSCKEHQKELCSRWNKAVQVYEQRIQGIHMGMYTMDKRHTWTQTKTEQELLQEHAHSGRNTFNTLTRSVVQREIVGSARFRCRWPVPKNREREAISHHPDCQVRSRPPQLSR
jgi:hypothetical protein